VSDPGIVVFPGRTETCTGMDYCHLFARTDIQSVNCCVTYQTFSNLSRPILRKKSVMGRTLRCVIRGSIKRENYKDNQVPLAPGRSY
jgi:hypothetical protein